MENKRVDDVGRPIADTLSMLSTSKEYTAVNMSFGETYYGYVLRVSRHWALLQLLHGFVYEGYMCVRIGDITSLEPNEFIHQCAFQEGLHSEVVPPFKIRLTTLKTVLEDVMANCRLFFLEMDYLEEPCRLLGTVQKFTEKGILFRKMGANGRWESKRGSEISFKQVSGVSFGNRYCQMFEKYSLLRK